MNLALVILELNSRVREILECVDANDAHIMLI